MKLLRLFPWILAVTAVIGSDRVAAQEFNPALVRELLQLGDEAAERIRKEDPWFVDDDAAAARRVMTEIPMHRFTVEGGDGFRPMRIAVDTSQLLANYAPTNDIEQARLDLVLNDMIDVVVKKWEEALNIRQHPQLNFQDNGVMDVPPSGTCLGFGEFPDDAVDADYLLIVTGFRANEGECSGTGESGVVGFAAHCARSLIDLSPRAGFIAFCMERFDYDADSKLLLPLLNTIGLHEIGHALGWSSGQFLYFNAPENLPKSPLGGVSGDFPCANSESSADRKPKVLQGKEYGYPYDHLYYELQSSKMAQISRNIFNCPSMTGARLENQPTSSSCFGSHLDERLYWDSLMGPFGVRNEGSATFSALTLAFMEDTGWYKPNYRLAGEVGFGAGAGCDFVERECIDRETQTIHESMRGFFCDFTEPHLKCEPGHRSRAHCLNVVALNNTRLTPSVPTEYQYFFDETIGGFQWTDYCPIVTEYDPTRIDVENACPNEQRCFEREGDDSVCLDFQCDADKYQVHFTHNSKKHKCKADFETIEVEGMGLVVCPRVAAICPSIGCPAHCSGAGYCDWTNKPGPKCICFDPEDATKGCYGDGLDDEERQGWQGWHGWSGGSRGNRGGHS